MILNVYTRHAEYLPTQLIYSVHGLSLDFCYRDGTNVYSNVSQHSNVLLPIHTQTQERIGRKGVRNALVRIHGSEGVSLIVFDFHLHTCAQSLRMS